MKILGKFKYHIYTVKLDVNDDETKYRVTITEGSLGQLRDRSKKPEITVHPFDNLSAARTAFENAVENVLRQTSLTDVSLYGQNM